MDCSNNVSGYNKCAFTVYKIINFGYQNFFNDFEKKNLIAEFPRF